MCLKQKHMISVRGEDTHHKELLRERMAAVYTYLTNAEKEMYKMQQDCSIFKRKIQTTAY